MLFCPFQRRASEPLKPPSDLDYLLMDLSSIEGTPMVHPKFIVPPYTTIPLACFNSISALKTSATETYLNGGYLTNTALQRTTGLVTQPFHNKWQYKLLPADVPTIPPGRTVSQLQSSI
ncbi:hypothetical protein N7453_009445 [Penicillium expansum]|nr:hypothetical protein N7453_009445 [Penicillium expansum]